MAKKLPHPSLDIVDSHGTELAGKNIVLCVAGSVAAYKSIELARLLMRHGANVKCVMSNASTKLIKPDYMKWATGNNVITKLTGDMEHIELADYKRSDLLIVYPSTANTLGKLATGIDDTPISTVLTVAFGSKIPIVMGLAMHRSMYENAAGRKNMEFLKKKNFAPYDWLDFRLSHQYPPQFETTEIILNGIPPSGNIPDDFEWVSVPEQWGAPGGWGTGSNVIVYPVSNTYSAGLGLNLIDSNYHVYKWNVRPFGNTIDLEEPGKSPEWRKWIRPIPQNWYDSNNWWWKTIQVLVQAVYYDAD